jgi:hypothetical protein
MQKRWPLYDGGPIRAHYGEHGVTEGGWINSLWLIPARRTYLPPEFAPKDAFFAKKRGAIKSVIEPALWSLYSAYFTRESLMNRTATAIQDIHGPGL